MSMFFQEDGGTREIVRIPPTWIRRCYIRKTAKAKIRPGEQAEIIGVETVQWKGYPGPLACFRVQYPDGDVDHIAIVEDHKYVIEPLQEETANDQGDRDAG